MKDQSPTTRDELTQIYDRAERVKLFLDSHEAICAKLCNWPSPEGGVMAEAYDGLELAYQRVIEAEFMAGAQALRELRFSQSPKPNREKMK